MSSLETWIKNEPLPSCKTEVALGAREDVDHSLLQGNCTTDRMGSAIPAADFQRKVHNNTSAAARLNFFNEIQALDRFLEETSLSASAISLWFALIRTSNRLGWKNPFSVSISVLIQRSGLQRRNIYKARDALKAERMIDFHERPGRQSSEYTIYSLADRYPIFSSSQVNACDGFHAEPIAGADFLAGQDTALGIEQGIGVGPDTGIITDTDVGTPLGISVGMDMGTIHKTIQSRTKRINKKLSPVQEESFNRFWEAYPRKEGKENARREWLKLKPDNDLADEIVLSVIRKAVTPEWLREGGRYIPGASRYLRDRRWEDAIPTTQDAFSQAMNTIYIEKENLAYAN